MQRAIRLRSVHSCSYSLGLRRSGSEDTNTQLGVALRRCSYPYSLQIVAGSGRSRATHTGEASCSVEGNLYGALLEGRSFKCTQCGKCCTGPGEVWATDAECQALADHFGLSLQHFLKRYTKDYSRKTGWRMLKSQPGGNQECVFLGKDNLCTVHSLRPLQCATYPWWPELLDPQAWHAEAQQTCEGFDHPDAEPLDIPSASKQLNATLAYFAQRDATPNSRGGKADNVQ